jgi:hypothetical protein
VRIFSYIEASPFTLTPMTTSSSKPSKKDTKQVSLTDQSANLEDVAVKFWKQAEAEASALEVTVDYYLMEFYTS